MNCENIHKKNHTGSHLKNIFNQESWSEIQFESVYHNIIPITFWNQYI